MNEQDKTFSEIAIKYAGALRRFALSLCRNDFDADDLVSETIIKAYENLRSLKDRNKVRQWLFRILHNEFISNCRSRKKFSDIPYRNSEDGIDNFSLFEALESSTLTSYGDPEKSFISMLTNEKILSAIDSLQDEFRAAIELCDVESFSYSEIAVILKVPIGTVRSRISRARIILQKKLWLEAEELGIKAAKNRKKKKDHICTCGKEEEEIVETESISL
jgi:RNA polymerase sigma-70 factor, ECF subfamily